MDGERVSTNPEPGVNTETQFDGGSDVKVSGGGKGAVIRREVGSALLSISMLAGLLVFTFGCTMLGWN